VSVSCFYEGTVRHRRRRPEVEFSYPLTLAYLDLDELPGLLGGRLVRRSFGPLRFRREDYLGAAEGDPLDDAVRNLVEERTGRRPGGAIRLLTQLRSFGSCFNPVSFYYCYGAGGTGRLEAVVAEVTNTPWGERHAYVVAPEPGDSRVLAGEFAKEFHVSPFMGMDHQYTCRASDPAQTLSVQIESRQGEELAFDATLALHRRELNRASVRRHVARFPLDGLRVLALIYGNALRLKLAGAPYFPHPRSEPA
jgi:DUF1365 family protein